MTSSMPLPREETVSRAQTRSKDRDPRPLQVHRLGLRSHRLGSCAGQEAAWDAVPETYVLSSSSLMSLASRW